MAKVIVGIVTADSVSKTITVVSSGRKTHPIYKKQYPVSKKYLVHDEKNEAKNGDKVSIVETRPLSARKHFKLLKIIERPKLTVEALEVTKDAEASKRPDSKSKKTDEEAES